MIRLLPVLALLLFSLPAGATTVEALLARVGPALRGLDYQGTLVVAAEGRVDTLRVFHRVDDGRERERLVALTGPVREVIRDGRKVMCFGTGDEPIAYEIAQDGRWSPAIAVSEAAGREGYLARLAGEARIAGRPVRRVDVLAADGWRYGYRLWLDRETHLPLRVDLLDARGRTLEQVAFADIAVGRRPTDEDLAPTTPAQPAPPRTLPSATARAPAWQVAALPPGFRLRAAKPLPDGGAHLLYSDGLASVSVYVEPAQASLRGGSQQQRGAVHARSFWVDGWQVMAIGKVPAATVDHFARNLRALPGDG